MKKKLLLLTAILGIALVAGLGSCSKKGITDPVTLDKAAGKWSINAVRYQISNGSATKDSTIPWRPAPENFVSFDGVASMQYCFNNSGVMNGEYTLVGNDSISLRVDHQTTRWKILLLTGTNFNIESTSSNSTDFPGATVKTYQSFVR